MRLALSCAALLALAAPVAAQSNAERVVNDAYTGRTITTWCINVSRSGTSIGLDLARRPRDDHAGGAPPGLDSVILDAGKGLVVSRVVDARGTSLRSTAHGDTLVVYPRARSPSTTRALFDRLPRAHRQRPRADVIEPRPGAPAATDLEPGEDHNNHFWFPTYDFPNDKIPGSSPPPCRGSTAWSRTAAGHRPAQSGRHPHRHLAPGPSQRDLSRVLIVHAVKLADTWRGMPVEYYVYRADSSRARRLFA